MMVVVVVVVVMLMMVVLVVLVALLLLQGYSQPRLRCHSATRRCTCACSRATIARGWALAQATPGCRDAAQPRPAKSQWPGLGSAMARQQRRPDKKRTCALQKLREVARVLQARTQALPKLRRKANQLITTPDQRGGGNKVQLTVGCTCSTRLRMMPALNSNFGAFRVRGMAMATMAAHSRTKHSLTHLLRALAQNLLVPACSVRQLGTGPHMMGGGRTGRVLCGRYRRKHSSTSAVLCISAIAYGWASRHHDSPRGVGNNRHPHDTTGTHMIQQAPI